MRETASFYYTPEWKKTRAAYAKSVGCLCEMCLKEGRITPSRIVHHKVFITPENVNDPSITLGWDNLMCVCMDCHAKIHSGIEKRFKVDELGRVTAI